LLPLFFRELLFSQFLLLGGQAKLLLFLLFGQFLFLPFFLRGSQTQSFLLLPLFGKFLFLQSLLIVGQPQFFLLLLFFSLNLETAAYFYEYDPHSQVAAISVLWALSATSMMGLGFWERNTAYRIVSITVFGATILKVFFFDMANVETPYRIVSFLVLGLLLIGASYLYHQFVDRLNLVPPPIPETERK